jgi:hypothetical protein
MVDNLCSDADVDPLAADVAAQWKDNEAIAIATGMLSEKMVCSF